MWKISLTAEIFVYDCCGINYYATYFCDFGSKSQKFDPKNTVWMNQSQKFDPKNTVWMNQSQK